MHGATIKINFKVIYLYCMHFESIFSFKYKLNALTQSNWVDCSNVRIRTATTLCIVSNYVLHFKHFYILVCHNSFTNNIFSLHTKL